MINTLRNIEFRPDGIFGSFRFEGDEYDFMETLQHAYSLDNGSGEAKWLPKVPPGMYRCARGIHALANGIPFETFEITGVVGHSGILFHKGNFSRDSEGCVLCGKTEVVQANGEKMITSSGIEFDAFIARLEGVDEFDLEVI